MLSIEELWSFAAKSTSDQLEQIKVEIREADHRVLKAERLPVVYGDANLHRNLIIPTTPVPAIAFDPDAMEGAVLPLKFATKWSSKAGLQMEWELFNPSRQADIEESELQTKIAKLKQDQQRYEWKKDATLAYAAVVLATLQYEMAVEDTVRYSEVLRITRDRFDAGRESSAQYIAAQQEMERKRIQLFESWAVLKETNLELQKYINLEGIQVLSSDMDEIHRKLKSYRKTTYEVALIQYDELLSRQKLRNIERQFLPSISMNSYYGSQYYSNEFDISEKRNWYGSSYINVALRLPISYYFTSSKAIERSNLQIKLEEIRGKEQEKIDRLSEAQLEVKRLAAEQKITGFKKIESLALIAQKEQWDAYKSGRLLLSDYNEANDRYVKAQQDSWQAQYDWIKVMME